MPLPHAREARLFYQTALQRYDDAEYLLEGGRTTGAVYLAGYGVECMLKALVLAQTPAGKRARLVESFRGKRAHDYEWLISCYLDRGGVPFPKPVLSGLGLLEVWSTDLRYVARRIDKDDAKEFLRATRTVMECIDGRL
jgi:HEPN domain-containing protein